MKELGTPNLRDEIFYNSADEFAQVLEGTAGKFREGRLDEVRADLAAAETVFLGAITQLAVLEALDKSGVEPEMQRELVMGETVSLTEKSISEEDDQVGNIREQGLPDLTDHQYTIAMVAFAVDPKLGEYVHETIDDVAKAAFDEKYAKMSKARDIQEQWFTAARAALATQTTLLMNKLRHIDENPNDEHPERVVQIYDMVKTQPEFEMLSLGELELVARRELSMQEVLERNKAYLNKTFPYSI